MKKMSFTADELGLSESHLKRPTNLNTLIPHRPGDVVNIAPSVDATVQRVQLNHGDHVDYLCAWWHNGERKTEWIPAREVR